jgi:hypothetical protein
MKKFVNISGLVAIISLAVGPALAQHSDVATQGGGAPAPEIGAGVLGVLLSVAAVKYFRQRSRD